MIKIILETIKKHNLIEENAKIVMGLSGGSDSMCLLYILNKIKIEKLLAHDFDLVAVHINHNLRGEESNQDEKFVKNFCYQNGINLIIYDENIKQLSIAKKMTIEEVARLYRKEKFESLLTSSKDCIALAHNYSDNAETILMHLFRGSGLNGLTSMSFKDGNIIRPILESTKEDIYSFLEENSIPYRVDKTNFEEIYSRNKVRLSLLPYLEENFNSNIISSLNNTIKTLKVDNDFIEQETKKAYNEIVIKKNDYISLEISKLSKLHEAILTRLLITVFCDINGSNVDLNSKNLSDIKSLLQKESGKQIRINKNLIAYKGYTELIFIEEKKCNFSPFSEKVNINEITQVSENIFIVITNEQKNFEGYNVLFQKEFCFDTKEEFFLRNKRDGDKIYMEKLNGHKELKKYFAEEKIDLIFRNNIKLLVTKDNLLMILDKKLISTDNFNIGNLSYFIQMLEKMEVSNEQKNRGLN